MKENTLAKCNLLLTNRESMKSVFNMENPLMYLSGACFFTMKSESVDKVRLEECKKLIKSRVDMFSNFRGSAYVPVTSMLVEAGDSSTALEQGLKVYGMMKKHFMASDYLPFVSMVIAKSVPESRYDEIASRSKEIYNMMKKDHPILTSSEDSAFCVLMALSEKDYTELVKEAEICFNKLKSEFFSENAVQSLSHVLALCEGTVEEKCQNTLTLYNMLKKAGRKYGTSYELPMLGVLATSGGDLQAICDEMIEVEKWLADQKGFGFFSNIDQKTRLMYAGMMIQAEQADKNAMSTAVVNTAISIIIAEQIAICACIAACSAAAAASC